MKSDEQVVALIKGLTNEVNKNEGSGEMLYWRPLTNVKEKKVIFIHVYQSIWNWFESD